jgi:hypothetical protein
VGFNPADRVDVVDGGKQAVGHRDGVVGALCARQHRHHSSAQLQPVRMPGTQRSERLQRKLSGVDGASGDQRLRARDHDPGVGVVTDHDDRARVYGRQHRFLVAVHQVSCQSCVKLAPFLR